jgi:hypothetical protein
MFSLTTVLFLPVSFVCSQCHTLYRYLKFVLIASFNWLLKMVLKNVQVSKNICMIWLSQNLDTQLAWEQ